MSTESHVYLQIYRVVCRESFRVKFLVEQQRWLAASHKRARDEGFKRIVRQKALKVGVPDTVNFKSLTISNYPLLRRSEELTRELESLSAKISG